MSVPIPIIISTQPCGDVKYFAFLLPDKVSGSGGRNQVAANVSVSRMNCPSRARNAARGVKKMLDQFVSSQSCLSRPMRPPNWPVSPINRPSSRFFAIESSSADNGAKNAKYRDLQRKGAESGSLLNTHMDRAGAKQAGVGRPGSDGIFYLGIRPGDYETPKNYKKWKELGVGGKGEI